MIKSKFRITIPLCGLLLLSSCRTEELLHEVGQKEELSKKFITFTKKHENDVIDYGEGFKYLALRYDSIHKTNMTGGVDIAKLEEELQTNNKMSFSTSNEVAYIDFNVRSQLIEEENGDKWMVFPKVRGRKVEDLVVALLSEEQTKLGYYLVNEDSDIYKEIIEQFIEIYKNKAKKLNYYKSYSYKTYGRTTDIEEVIIRVPKPKRPGFSPYIGGGGDIGGGCSEYEMCVDTSPGGGGGGGGGSYPPPPDPPKPNPCEKAKEQVINNPEVQKAIAHLKQHLENMKNNTTKSERGWNFHKNGTITEADIVNNHTLKVGRDITMSDNTNRSGTASVDYFYHNHTSKGVDIFSPQDIASLIDMARFQDAGKESSAFMGVIAYDNINYIMRWTGGKEKLPQYNSFSAEQLSVLAFKQFNMYYSSFENPNLSKEQKLERVFFQTLDMMGVDSKNISLQKIDNNNVYTVSKNTDGSTQSQPCN